jgi:hypothetical protein
MFEWKDAASWLWVGVLGLIKILWSKQEDRFNKIEETMYTKSSAVERQSTVSELLEARRVDILHLHQKIDEVSHRLDGKVDKMKDDMNKGFNDVKDILLKR